MSMDGFDKSHAHERKWVPIEQLEPNPKNPNTMSGRQFDYLVENIESKGMTEDIEVREIGPDKYRIMSGHHRWEACKYLTWAEVPVVVNRDPDMGDEEESAQLVRMNVIKGKMDPDKFLALYQEMAEKHEHEVISDMFGFADEKEFERLIKQTENSLPPDTKKKFQEAKHEIKTIDDLAKVLNQLLWEEGDTLEYGYMIFDFNGHDAIWLRMQPKHVKLFTKLADVCRKEQRAMDDVMASLVELLAEGEDEDVLEYIRENVPKADFDLPNHTAPTRDEIEAI